MSRTLLPRGALSAYSAAVDHVLRVDESACRAELVDTLEHDEPAHVLGEPGDRHSGRGSSRALGLSGSRADEPRRAEVASGGSLGRGDPCRGNRL